MATAREVLGGPVSPRRPAHENAVARARVRYVTACTRLPLEFRALTLEQRTDYRDRLATARDALGAAIREAEQAADLEPMAIWWEQPGYSPGWVYDVAAYLPECGPDVAARRRA